MADSTIPNLSAFTGTPNGTEVIETVQSGASVKIPSQKIADLATIVTPINLAGMTSLISGSQVSVYKLYVITNSTQGRILVKGLSTTTLEAGALNLTTGASGTYVFGTDTFTPSAGGNANVTPITVTALQNLRSTSTLSTTTLYNVTNAVSGTLVLQVYAIASNTNVVYAIDVATGAIGTYNITTDAFTVAVPDLQQVTTAGDTTTNSITVDNGTDSVTIQPNQLKIANGTGYGTIAAANLTADPNFELPDKPTGTYTFAMLSDVTGDVVGPASAVNNNIALYDNTTGKLIKDGGYSVSTSTADIASSVKVPVWTAIVTYVTGLGYLLASTAASTYQAILTAANMHTFVDSLNTMTTPADADRMLIVDNSASLAKKITWANIKATLSSTFLPLTGGSLSGALNEAKGADIASAATTDIGAATGNYVVVTGTTTITALGTVQAGTRRIVKFSGVLILTHNATSLILPTTANITTAAGDTATFVSLGSGNWVCVSYQRASGAALLGGGQSPITSAGAGTSVTGTTANTYSKGLLIPANSRGANDVPQIDIRAIKTGTAGTLTLRIYWNTTNDLAGSPILIGVSAAGAAGTLIFGIERILSIEAANGTGAGTKSAPTSVALQTDWGAQTSAQSTLLIDWTSAGYLIIAVQNGSSADSSVGNMIKLH